MIDLPIMGNHQSSPLSPPPDSIFKRDALAQLRGIGLAFATVLGNEVFFRDFRNRREVGGYLGLAPSPWQSGGVGRDQGIAKSGNPRARRTAIELAWLWLR